MNKIKRIIGKICTGIVYSVLALLLLSLSIMLIEEFGVLLTIIFIIAGIVVIFSMWAAVNWRNL